MFCGAGLETDLLVTAVKFVSMSSSFGWLVSGSLVIELLLPVQKAYQWPPFIEKEN